MSIERNPHSRFLYADQFIDTDTGQAFSESPHHPGMVHVTDVVLYGTGMPVSEGARYFGGDGSRYALHSVPNLAQGVEYAGSREDILTMAIHPQDVPKFVQRVNAWRIATENVIGVRQENGSIEFRRPGRDERLAAMKTLSESHLFFKAMGATMYKSWSWDLLRANGA